MTKEVFTTGEVAKICNVAPRTVCRWFDAGRLRGYRNLVGSRRIPWEALLDFLKENGIPTDGLDVPLSRAEE